MNQSIYHRHNIILYNVLNQEVVFEEYFCNLLQIQEFRNLFLLFVKIDNSKICYHNFNTEVSLKEKCGRADLYLNFDNQKYIFEIKNKCNTNLTDNQPKNYLKHLDNKNQNLFFIIPRQYKHIGEIKKRWQDENNYIHIEKQILFWEDFIESLKKSKIYDKYIEIKMFYDFCLYWFNLETIKFSKDEQIILKKGYLMNDFNNKSIPKVLQKLEEIVDNIGTYCNLKIDNEVIGGYTYSLTVNQYIVYFGISYNLWDEIGIPISIEIQNINSDYQEFELNLNNVKLKPKIYKETAKTDRQFSLYVNLNYKVDDDFFQENTIKTILDIIKQLQQH